jgi:hypothetical protein
MITGLEIPFIFALLYPSLNYIWLWPKLKPDIEKEIEHEQQEMDGVEIWDYHNEYSPPIYLNLNNIVIPVGGYTSKVTKTLLTKHISKDKQKEYHQYYQIDNEEDSKRSHTKTSHINTQEAFVKTFKYYNIPTDRFAINLPLKINYYNYKNGFYLHRLGGIASDKEKLVKDVLWRKRLPLTITIPSITMLCFTACWLYYAISSHSIYSEPYYPPFHYKRINSYFNIKK